MDAILDVFHSHYCTSVEIQSSFAQGTQRQPLSCRPSAVLDIKPIREHPTFVACIRHRPDHTHLAAYQAMHNTLARLISLIADTDVVKVWQLVYRPIQEATFFGLHLKVRLMQNALQSL